MNTKTSFFTLLLLISFGSVNAVLFTPALPAIANYFKLTSDYTQNTLILFLVGYALGQLVYSPIANRYGRKPALYCGISLQILSSAVCVGSGYLQDFYLLLLGRFLLGLGSGVGLKMTFTMANESYKPKVASKKVSYLTLAFAIAPGLSVALGGYLVDHFSWVSCFYAGMVYGIFLLVLITFLPETLTELDLKALKFKKLINDYIIQFRNSRLISGGLMIGGCSSFVYLFAAIAPFLAIDIGGVSPSQYGVANLLPPIGLLLGSLTSAQLTKTMSLKSLIHFGLIMVTIGVVMMLITMLKQTNIIISIFIPMMIIFFGLCFIISNTSTIAMSQITDKSHASAVLNFLNMGLATSIVYGSSYFPVRMLVLPCVFFAFILIMLFFYKILIGGCESEPTYENN